MSKYWLGLILALTAPMLHAGANIVDGLAVSDGAKPLTPIIFLYSALNTLSLPIICSLDFPAALPLNLLGIVALIASIEVLYQYPYLHALRAEETSVVTSLFSLGKVLTPLFALILVGERLEDTQYFGFGLIVISCTMLALDLNRLRPQKSWWLMLTASSLLSFQAVLYKYAFTHGAGWGTVIFWSTVLELAITSSILVTSRNLFFWRGKLPPNMTVPLVGLGQALTWGGTVIGLYALLFIPVSVSNSLEELQAIFVLILGLVLSQKGCYDLIGERPVAKQVFVKLFLMLLAVGGAWLVAVPL